MDVVDVAIAGGGPGGLATAAALIAAFDGKLRVKVQYGCIVHSCTTRLFPSLFSQLCQAEMMITPTCALYKRLKRLFRT